MLMFMVGRDVIWTVVSELTEDVDKLENEIGHKLFHEIRITLRRARSIIEVLNHYICSNKGHST